MRYLVTGGAGFIGSHLVDALLDRGDGVIVLDDFSTGRRENLAHVLHSDRLRLIEGCVTNEELVDDCMRSADACFHLASAVGVQLIVEKTLDSLLRNVRGADVVMCSAARHRRRLLFTSTSEVYGKRCDGALVEDADRLVGSPFKPRWAYATSKAFGEVLAHGFVREHGCEMIVVRLFNTVGPRQTGAYGMVVPRFVQQALSGADLTVHGNGQQTRCFLHVHDTVRAILLVADSDRAVGNVLNVGSFDEIAIRDLARRVIERCDSRSRMRFIPYSEAYGDGFEELGRRVPETAALRKLTGWQPTRSLDQAIDDVIAYENGVSLSEEKEAAVAV